MTGDIPMVPALSSSSTSSSAPLSRECRRYSAALILGLDTAMLPDCVLGRRIGFLRWRSPSRGSSPERIVSADRSNAVLKSEQIAAIDLRRSCRRQSAPSGSDGNRHATRSGQGAEQQGRRQVINLDMGHALRFFAEYGQCERGCPRGQATLHCGECE